MNPRRRIANASSCLPLLTRLKFLVPDSVIAEKSEHSRVRSFIPSRLIARCPIFTSVNLLWRMHEISKIR